MPRGAIPFRQTDGKRGLQVQLPFLFLLDIILTHLFLMEQPLIFFQCNIIAYNTTCTCRVSFLCNNTCPIVQESNNYWILLWVPLEKSQVPNRTFWLENPEMNQSDGHWEQIKYIYYSNTGLKTGWADNHWVYTSWCSSGNAAAPSSIFILFNVFECSSLICWRIGRMYIVSLKICSQSAEKKNKF